MIGETSRHTRESSLESAESTGSGRTVGGKGLDTSGIMSSAGLVAEIVSLLNKAPFSRDLSLVAFDEMSPYDLLCLLNSIFIHLDKRHKVDMRDESQAAMSSRMLEFVQIMKYPIPGGAARSQDFIQEVVMGQRRTVYPLLHYFLSKRPQLEKRAYLAPFLVPIEVPQQMMLDTTVNSVYQQYRNVQKEFSEIHRAYDSMRGSSMAPSELQREIKQLGAEREQLKDKIESMREKTKDMRGFAEIHGITAGLRKEQEEEARLEERRMEQVSFVLLRFLYERFSLYPLLPFLPFRKDSSGISLIFSESFSPTIFKYIKHISNFVPAHPFYRARICLRHNNDTSK